MEKAKKILMILLCPHWLLILLLCVISAVSLVWVFVFGHENSWMAYPVYVLSAYSLTVLCIWLVPYLFRRMKQRNEEKHAITQKLREERFRKSLGTNISINLVYTCFNFIGGFFLKSAWMASNGLYYLVNACIHFVLLKYEAKLEKITDRQRKLHLGWSGFQFFGVMLFVLHLTMTGRVFQMIWQGRSMNYPGVLIFGVAAFTFYKLIRAIVRVIQCRRIDNPIFGASRNIDLSEAMLSLFSLQTALLTAFGGDFQYAQLMNSLTGGAVCLLAVLGAVGMVFHGRRKKKELTGEESYGE